MDSLPALLAMAGGTRCDGVGRCVYCGAPASAPHQISDTFTGQDTLAAPGSPYRCAGCTLAMQEAGTAGYPDGTTQHFSKAYRRMLSHVVTAATVTQATKAHLAYLRGICLDPPEPPYAISLAVSGQKHILYRGRVNRSREWVTATLETELVTYRPDALRDLLAVAGRVCAATGKPCLAESPTASVWLRLAEHHGDTGPAWGEHWFDAAGSPLGRLAAFLCPNKEDSQREYPAVESGRVPPARGGLDRPARETDRRGGDGRNQGDGRRSLFDDL